MYKFQVTAEDYAARYGDSIIQESLHNGSARITAMFANKLVAEVRERIAIAGEDAPPGHTSRAIDAVAKKYETASTLINHQAIIKGYPAVLLPLMFKPLLKQSFPDTLGNYIR